MQQTIIDALSDPTFWIVIAIGAALGWLMMQIWARGWPFVKQAILTTENTALRWVFGFAWLLAPIWLALILTTLTGLYGIITTTPEFVASKDVELRWHVLAYIGLITALGGLIAAPLTILRLFFTNRQTVATEEGLITDRINKAVEALGAEKEVNRLGRTLMYKHEDETHRIFEWQDTPETIPEAATIIQRDESNWKPIGLTEPNLEVRIGGILALERISQDSLRDHVQIMEILTAYLRQNAGGKVPDGMPEDVTDRKAWLEWRLKNQAQPPRLDIDAAFRVIKRRGSANRSKEADGLGYRQDLSRAPFAGLHLAGLDFDKALLSNAKLQGAVLIGAELQRADFSSAELQGADLSSAELQGADLSSAKLQGADLSSAKLQRANLGEAELQGANLSFAELQGADLWSAELQRANLSFAELQGANLSSAKLQAAVLGRAELQGANLWRAELQRANLSSAKLQAANLVRAEFDENTDLRSATLRGALVRSVDFKSVPEITGHVSDMFGVGEIRLPEGVDRPDHWIDQPDDWNEINRLWRDWIISKGWDDVPLPEAEDAP